MKENKDNLALPKAISIKPALYEEARKKADALGLSFSQLVCFLIKQELKNGDDFTISAEKKDEEGYSKF